MVELQRGVEDFHLLAAVPIAFSRIVRPDNLFSFRVDFGDDGSALLHHNMPIFEHVKIVNTAPGHLPFDTERAFKNRNQNQRLSELQFARHAARKRHRQARHEMI